MPDQSEVETTLAQSIETALYPNGTAAPSILNRAIRIFRGWPNQSALDADLAAGRLNVSVFPDPLHQQNTTRYPAEYRVAAPVTPTLTVITTPNTATFAGTADPGQLVGLLVDNIAAVHRTQPRDTPELVAAILAADLAPYRFILVSGATVTIPSAHQLIARVVADQPARMEIRRQRQLFRLTAWCPDPATRDACASAIDAALAAITFLNFTDGTYGNLRFHSSTVFDQHQDAALYRRDLVYAVEYATTLAATLPAMLFGDATIAPNQGPTTQSLLG